MMPAQPIDAPPLLRGHSPPNAASGQVPSTNTAVPNGSLPTPPTPVNTGDGEGRHLKPKALPCKYCSKRFR